MLLNFTTWLVAQEPESFWSPAISQKVSAKWITFKQIRNKDPLHLCNILSCCPELC